jgi:hypothetical protein
MTPALRAVLLAQPPFPKRLFRGRRGAWWDNQDLSTLFSDSARTTLAVVDGPVGGQTDKSGNGNHRTQTTAGNRPVLKQRSDGVYYLDYSSGKSLSVPSSTGLFNYLHDGTGGTIVSFVEWIPGATSSTHLRNATGTTHVGVLVGKDATNQGLIFNAVRGGSGTVTTTGRLTGFANSGAPRMYRFSYQNNGAANDSISSSDSSVVPSNDVTANAPSAAAASFNMQVDSSFNSYEYEVVIREGVLTESEVQALWRRMRAYDYAVPATVDLTLIIGGQSNASGRGTLNSIAAEQWLTGAYSYTKAEEFRVATVPEHSVNNVPVATNPTEGSPVLHGFSLRAAKSLKTDSGQDVLLVPCAVGSTSVAQWDTPATVANRSTLFGAMAYRYQQAAVKGGDPVIVWSGHEASASTAFAEIDYVNGGVGSTYRTAFETLFVDIRANIVDAPLIFVQLSCTDDLTLSQHQAAAGEAQRQAESTIANAHMVVSHDVARNAATDDQHVSRAGVDVIADRLALAIRQHVLGEPVNGTGPRIVGATYSGSVVTLTCDKAIDASATNYGTLFRVYAAGVEQTVSSAVRNADTTKIDITCSAPLVGAITLTYGYRAGAASAARTDFVKDSDGLPLPLFGPIVATA